MFPRSTYDSHLVILSGRLEMFQHFMKTRTAMPSRLRDAVFAHGCVRCDMPVNGLASLDVEHDPSMSKQPGETLGVPYLC